MRNLLQLLLPLCLIFSTQVKSQCPTAGFTLPDTVCVGSLIQITNTSTGSGPLNSNWDFNSKDYLDSLNGHIIGTFPSDMAGALGVDLAEQNDTLIALTITNSGTLCRYTFGNNINNVPIKETLGNLGLISAGFDLEIVQSNGNWHAFVPSFFSGELYHLNFGNSLFNTPTVSSMFHFTFSLPVGISFAEENGNYVGYVSNFSGNSISILNYGNDLNSTPVITSVALPGTNPFSVQLIKTCTNWYGYVGYISSNDVTVIDFGATLSNTVANPNLQSFTLPNGVRNGSLIQEGDDNILLYVNSNGSGLTSVNLGNNPLTINPVITPINTNGLFSSHLGNMIRKIGSRTMGLCIGFSSGEFIAYDFKSRQPHFTGSTSTISNPTISFPGCGTYQVTLQVQDPSNNTYSTISDSIYVSPTPAPYFDGTSVCLGDSITLIDLDTYPENDVISKVWDMDNGDQFSSDTVNYLYPVSGTYFVSLSKTNTAGCVSNYTDTVFIRANPQAGFLFPDTSCSGSSINFNDNSISTDGSITAWQWIIGNDTLTQQNNSYTFSIQGSYPVLLHIVTEYGCTDSIYDQTEIIPGPVADFTVTNSCLGQPTAFQNNSTIPAPLPLTYTWQFGDGNSSTTENPTYQYIGGPNNYLVSLVTEASNGCSNTYSSLIRISPPPTPAFTTSKDTACVGNLFQFTDQSQPATGETISKRVWDFGDGTKDSTTINPSHNYSSSGNYTVVLTVTSPTSCDSSFTKSIYVIDSPQTLFSSTDECVGNAVVFTDQSTPVAGSNIVSWLWVFGDNDSSQVQNPTHLYTNPGTYTSSLIVTDNFGCQGNFTDTIDVYPLPVVRFGFTKACTDSAVQFTDSSGVSSGILQNWTWNFGDGSTITSISNPAHSYSQAAAYPVTLVVTTDNGCIDSLNKLIVVNQSPKFNVNIGAACHSSPNNFSYTVSGITPVQPVFLWNFGDQTVSFLSITTHTYNQPGTYPVSLTITDLFNGCEKSVTDTARVYSIPDADFVTDSGCVGDTLQFTDLSTITNDQLSAWSWSIGNSGTSALQHPAFVGTVADSIPVRLTVSTIHGCKDSITRYAEIYPIPHTDYTPSVTSGSIPLEVTFTNNSDPGTYTWDFGDNSGTTSVTSPVHIFTDTSFYSVQLTTVSSRGCSSSKSRLIYVLTPYLDLAIEGVSFEKQGDYWLLKAQLHNYSNLEVKSFDLNIQFDGKSPVWESVDNLPLAAGAQSLYTLSTKFAVTNNEKPAFLCMTAENINEGEDQNPANNHKCALTSNEFNLAGIYPNPFGNYMNLGLNIPSKNDLIVKIWDVSGKVLRSEEKYSLNEGFTTLNIDASHLASGLYVIELQFGLDIIRTKAVKY